MSNCESALSYKSRRREYRLILPAYLPDLTEEDLFDRELLKMAP